MAVTLKQPADKQSVTIIDDTLHLEDYQTDDLEIVHFFAARQDAGEAPAATLERALKFGVMTLESVGTPVAADYLDQAAQRLLGQVQHEMDQRLASMNQQLEKIFAADNGALARALQEYLGKGGKLEDLFDPKRADSALGKLREIMHEYVDGADSKMAKLLDPTNPNSPLRKLREEFIGTVDSVRRQLEAYRQEEAERAAAALAARAAQSKAIHKGLDYQELVHQQVAEIAKTFGDTAAFVANEAGRDGSKTGDVVVTLNPSDTGSIEVNLVFEAKDKALGLTPTLAELAKARSNRGSAAAVAVFSSEDLSPKGSAPFSRRGQVDYICVLDKDNLDLHVLRFAYYAARYWAIASLRPAEVPVNVDVKGIMDDLQRAEMQLRAMTEIKKQLTSIRNAVDTGADGLRQKLDDLQAQLEETLRSMKGRIPPPKGGGKAA